MNGWMDGRKPKSEDVKERKIWSTYFLLIVDGCSQMHLP
jgi:hypothetical protein